MPIEGVPLVLEKLLVSVLSSHSLNSWNIFNEQNGNVSFRLRFSPLQNGDPCISSQVSKNQVSTYKRKSQSQVRRDKDRAMRHTKFVDKSSNKELELCNCVDNHTTY